MLVLDDSVLDKPYARTMELVHHLWSGKHHRVVKGLDLLTLLWTAGDRHVPCDDRLYDKPNDGQTKNDHFGDLLRVAHERHDGALGDERPGDGRAGAVAIGRCELAH